MLLGLTLLNAVMGLHQEGKAEASVSALQKMLIVIVVVSGKWCECHRLSVGVAVTVDQAKFAANSQKW